MCGRFFLFGDGAAVQTAFPGIDIPHPFAPRYNIAPGQPIAIIPNTPERRVDHLVWGLVPAWAKDPRLGHRLINARAETLAEKPAFRAAYRRRRCVILANGFYEWYLPAGASKKAPLAFQSRPPGLIALAGLWEVWLAPDGSELITATIITTAANAFVAPYHQRMPVILAPSDYAAWLDPEERRPAELAHLLRPWPVTGLQAFPVSTEVNSVRHDSPACIEPTGETIFMDE